MDSQQRVELVNTLIIILIPIILVIFAMLGYLLFAYFKNNELL